MLQKSMSENVKHDFNGRLLFNRRWGVSVCDDSADINGGGGSKNMETIILERSLFKVILTGHTSSITCLKSYRAL